MTRSRVKVRANNPPIFWQILGNGEWGRQSVEKANIYYVTSCKFLKQATLHSNGFQAFEDNHDVRTLYYFVTYVMFGNKQERSDNIFTKYTT